MGSRGRGRGRGRPVLNGGRMTGVCSDMGISMVYGGIENISIEDRMRQRAVIWKKGSAYESCRFVFITAESI